jgi:CBS-domain-containing membrane protein
MQASLAASAAPTVGGTRNAAREGNDMLYSNIEDDRYGSIAFLDGSAAADPGPQAVLRRRRRSESSRRIALTDPAMSVLTDFTWDAPVTVAADRFIDDALRDMIAAGVRALLVMQGEVVIGLITSYDIQGERPLLFLDTSGLTRHSDIEVAHIMTPWDRVATVDLPWAASASVADLVERFRRNRGTHLMVVEYPEEGGAFVRGLFSRAELERQLAQRI